MKTTTRLAAALGLLLVCVGTTFSAEDAQPIAARMNEALATGKAAEGIAFFTQALAETPDDAQARFALGILQFVRGVERLGQSWYRYGLCPTSGFSDAVRLLSYIGLPLKIPDQHKEDFPNGYKMRSISIPTLLIHAAEDHLIPLHEAEELLRLSAAEEKRLVVIPRADHNTLMMVGRERYFQEIEEFVTKQVSQLS